MKQLLSILLFATFLYACKDKENKKETGEGENNVTEQKDANLISDSSWGLITATTDIDALKKNYGAGNVVDETICGPECADSIDVTKVYANTAKEMIVYWNEGAYHRTVQMVESYATGSPYHTSSGIRLGTTLSELLNINGKQIIFNGFDWDYGGYIADYGGGALANSSLGIRLDLPETGDHPLLGDSEFSTNMPEAKKYLDKIVVGTLTLSFMKGNRHTD